MLSDSQKQWFEQYKIKMQATNNSSELNGYVIGKTIGRGTFGKVKKAIHKLTGQPVAIKYLEKQKIKDITDVERVSRELHFLKLVRHPAIAQMYEIIETAKMIFIVMEFATGGEYFDYVMDEKVKNEEEAFHYFAQIVSALIYLHKLKISHRDVKPENILIDSHKRIKLVDFGLSNMYKKGQKLSTACGSPCYASPQMVRGQDYDPQLTDVWSLGIVLYTSIMAQLPFQDQNTNALYSKIKSGMYVIHKKISPQLKDLLSKLINTQPQNRLNLSRILEHPWYRKFRVKRQIAGIEIGYQNIPIDKNIVEQMQHLGYQSRKTIKFLQNNVKNICTTTYYLFMKRNFKAGRASEMDICSDSFEAKTITSFFSLNKKRYKSFDLGSVIANEKPQIQQRTNNRNCVSQFKHRYDTNKSQQNSIPLKKNSSIKSIDSKGKRSMQSFLKTRAELEVNQMNTKNIFYRNKSLSVSTDKSRNNDRYATEAVRSSNKKIKINIVNNFVKKQQRIKCRIKTDFIAQIYCPMKKSRSKKDNPVSKQKIRINPIGIDISNVFWRKKSTTMKQTTGTSAEQTRGIRRKITLNI